MIYDINWLKFSLLFLVIFLLGFFFRKYKVINIILPKKWNYGLLSVFQKIIMFLMLIIILIIPLNIWFFQWIKIVKKSTLNIEVLFDVSLSMTAKDLKPNRFEVAKQSLVNFIKNLDTDYNIWLITFSWRPFVYMPITNSNKAMVWKISHMKFSDFPPTMDFVWTAIWDALLLWMKELVDYSKLSKKPWVIILFTDGDSNKWVPVKTAIKNLKKVWIPVYVWAIWKQWRIIIWQDIYWDDVPTSIDLNMLENIAKQTWWEFKKIENKDDFLEILSKLYSYVKNFEQVKKERQYLFINFYLSIILIILLFIYFWLFVRFNFKK